MVGDELRVVDAFCAWLANRGWTTEREVHQVDVIGTRGQERLYAEAKGRTAAIGLDVDTLYGQLLRRMPANELGSAVFAVVVPTEAVEAVLRVPGRVRAALGIEVYSVAVDGSIAHVGDGRDPLS